MDFITVFLERITSTQAVYSSCFGVSHSIPSTLSKFSKNKTTPLDWSLEKCVSEPMCLAAGQNFWGRPGQYSSLSYGSSTTCWWWPLATSNSTDPKQSFFYYTQTKIQKTRTLGHRPPSLERPSPQAPKSKVLEYRRWTFRTGGPRRRYLSQIDLNSGKRIAADAAEDPGGAPLLGHPTLHLLKEKPKKQNFPTWVS